MSQHTKSQSKQQGLHILHNPGSSSRLLVYDPSAKTAAAAVNKTLLPTPSSPPQIHDASANTAAATNILNAHIKAGQKASRLNDLKALYITYAEIGVALGIRKECTDFIRRFSILKTSPNTRFHGNGDLMFKKDRANLEWMLADVDVEEKIKHVQQFIRRRRIPERVIRTLHVPKPIAEENSNCQIVEEVNITSDKCSKQSVGCQTMVDEVMRSDVGCQTVEKPAVDNDLLRHDVGCQAVEKSAKQDVSCQTVKLFGSNETDDPEDLNNENSAVGNKRKRGDGQEETRVFKRSTPCCNRSNCTDDDKLRESSKSGVTKLLVLNLHPNVTEDDISVMFRFNFKSYQSSKVNYYSTGKPLGTADIVFGERSDALKAKKKFNRKKLDGQAIDIVLLDQEIYD